MRLKSLMGVGLLALAGGAQAVTVLAQNFDNVPGMAGSGWVFTNNSTAPLGPQWFQGNSAIFTAATGAPDSYGGSNFAATNTLSGAVSNWLISPTILLDSTGSLSFQIRNAGEGFLDTVEIRVSTAGASSNVGASTTSLGDFTTLLSTFASSTTPNGWVTVTVPLTGISSPTLGRIAFRHVVGDVSTAGNYVGVDDVLVTSAIPEPTSALLMALGVAGLMVARRRRA
jgi:hypothetical protein